MPELARACVTTLGVWVIKARSSSRGSLNEIAHRTGLRLVPRDTQPKLNLLQEALHRCIVLDIPRSAHRIDHAMIGHEPLELLAGVFIRCRDQNDTAARRDAAHLNAVEVYAAA